VARLEGFLFGGKAGDKAFDQLHLGAEHFGQAGHYAWRWAPMRSRALSSRRSAMAPALIEKRPSAMACLISCTRALSNGRLASPGWNWPASALNFTSSEAEGVPVAFS